MSATETTQSATDVRGAHSLHRIVSLQLRLERDDSIPAFGGYLRCECPDPAHNHVILMNVQAVMAPEMEYEDGSPCPQTREDRKRLIITTLMHEFGHALEVHMNLPDCEAAIEAACEAWETQYAKQANDQAEPRRQIPGQEGKQNK